MIIKERLEHEQLRASKLYEDIKEVIEDSDCTFGDVISTLHSLARFYQEACTHRKIRQ